VVTIGFGLLLPLEILEKPRHGFINLHFSLLPRWRGAAPVQRAIEAGDSVTGVTVFQLDAGMDTGPIYTSAQIPLSVSTTADQLFQSLAILGVEPVLQTLELVERGERPTAQENAGASRAYKLSKEEGRIDWNLSAEVINRKVNAFNPAPGAWSNFRGQVIKIDKVRFSDQIALAGQLKVVEKSIYIGTATAALELLEVTPSGKAKMTAASWANGARLGATDMLQ
jgi:methionyl-tRNA formyltransferase